MILLWKEIAPAFGCHVEETPEGVDEIAGVMVLFGSGRAKLISEPQKCLIAPFSFLNGKKVQRLIRMTARPNAPVTSRHSVTALTKIDQRRSRPYGFTRQPRTDRHIWREARS